MILVLNSIILYFWAHAVIIIARTSKVKGYRRLVLIVALLQFILYIFGTLK